MKRYNLIQARGGEFSFGTEGLASEGEGSDVIELKIKRGTVSIVVPADLPDNLARQECFKHITCMDIELEDGTHITGCVRGGESQLEAESPALPPRHTTKKPARRASKHSLVTHQVLNKRVPNE